MSYDSGQFYQRLSGFRDFFEFSRDHHYRPLPDDWRVVVTDIVDSTAAIEAGRYRQVNAVGVATIVALTNALRPLAIPHVFGGDGITACIPESAVDRVRSALAASQRMARERFGLELRAGLVPLQAIHDAGHQVLVGKFEPHAGFRQAMFLGGGLRHAERLVKSAADSDWLLSEAENAGDADFGGFECRWREVPSPAEENIALLVEFIGSDVAQSERIYTEILGEIDRIYGLETQYNPLREENLSLSISFRALAVEAGIRNAFRSPLQRLAYLLKLQLLSGVGKALMALRVRTADTDWGQYKHQLILNTDYRKFDDSLRMVIAGSRGQRIELRRVLDEYREDGQLVYGLHNAPAALITCMVAEYGGDHVHFVDGADGGYALAAKEMKQQRRDLPGSSNQ